MQLKISVKSSPPLRGFYILIYTCFVNVPNQISPNMKNSC
uniref:Uncharacterized protein n=1 Tax=Anguilla anguilla TaxID=7936 RepID=A0A0E9PXD3_ANGAN